MMCAINNIRSINDSLSVFHRTSNMNVSSYFSSDVCLIVGSTVAGAITVVMVTASGLPPSTVDFLLDFTKASLAVAQYAAWHRIIGRMFT